MHVRARKFKTELQPGRPPPRAEVAAYRASFPLIRLSGILLAAQSKVQCVSSTGAVQGWPPPSHIDKIEDPIIVLNWAEMVLFFFFFGAQRARMSRNAQRWRGETPLCRCFGWGISIRHETRSLPRGKTARENTYKVVCSVQAASVPTNCKQLACCQVFSRD